MRPPALAATQVHHPFPPERYLPYRTTAEVAALPKDDAAVCVVVAAIEQHGPPLPLATDLILGQSLLTLTTAEQLYRQKYQVYGTLSDLAPEGTLDNVLGTGTKSLYQFTVSVAGDPLHYTMNATPIEDVANMSSYFTDDTTVIRVNIGSAADASSPPIPR